MIRVCILCYKLFWGNSTLCVSFVLFFIFVRVNAQFVKLNAQFARVNAQFVKENAQPDYPMNALLCICKTKRTLLPFKSLPVSVFLYNSPKSPRTPVFHGQLRSEAHQSPMTAAATLPCRGRGGRSSGRNQPRESSSMPSGTAVPERYSARKASMRLLGKGQG